MNRQYSKARLVMGLVRTSLLLALVACSREPAPVVALPPALEPAVASADDTASRSDRNIAESLPPEDQQIDGLRAAAGLPQPLSEPLVDDLRIDFEYGTLFEFARVTQTEDRQVSIEPIGTPIEEALDSLAASLKRAGFEPSPEQARDWSLHRVYRRAAEPRDMEIELIASSYAEPELAAHPGGTGSVAMHLRPIKGH